MLRFMTQEPPIPRVFVASLPQPVVLDRNSRIVAGSLQQCLGCLGYPAVAARVNSNTMNTREAYSHLIWRPLLQEVSQRLQLWEW